MCRGTSSVPMVKEVRCGKQFNTSLNSGSYDSRISHRGRRDNLQAARYYERGRGK